MQTAGTFRRNVGKTTNAKGAKLALRLLARDTSRVQIARGVVALKGHTGQLVQVMTQYLLGVPVSSEMKDDVFAVLGDVGYDLTALSRVLKVKLPTITRKTKLVGTRSAAILHLDSLSTNLLRQVETGAFTAPEMVTVKKFVTMPQKGGIKEERDVNVVATDMEHEAEASRQEAMRSFLSSAIDVYWRLCNDVFGKPPAVVLEAKLARLQVDHPDIVFESGAKKAKKLADAVPA